MAGSSIATSTSTRSTPSTTRSSAPRSRRHAAVEPLGTSPPEVSISATRLAALALAAIAVVVPSRLQAQEKNPDEENRVWRIEGLRTGFCVQLLINPQALGITIPQDSRPLRADAIEDLSPVLRTVITNQPEFAAWTPSSICLYYMETVDMGSLRVSERNPRKAPMIGIWALAAADGAGGARRDFVLRFFTNAARVERAGEMGGLVLRSVRSTVGELQNEETGTAIGTRYEFKLGKTLLTWDGRRTDDSTRANGPVAREWRAEKKRGGSVTARLVLTPEWTKSMVGSLRVEGRDDFAEAIKASPIRFVGPALLGGEGELAFRRR